MSATYEQTPATLNFVLTNGDDACRAFTLEGTALAEVEVYSLCDRRPLLHLAANPVENAPGSYILSITRDDLLEIGPGTFGVRAEGFSSCGSHRRITDGYFEVLP